jgi:TPR repeat protein
MTIDDLLAAPATPEAGRALLNWVGELRARIVRGEMMIGILPVEEIERAPIALRRAAECGLPDAWSQLASWLAAPPFGKPNIPEAESVLRTAMATGVPGATIDFVRLQWFYRRGEATDEEQREAFSLLDTLVARNPRDATAIHLLGLLTCQGFGTTADPAAAAAHQQLAASLGSADAMFELFIHYHTGLGVPADDAIALRWVRQAADAGHPRAMYNMGAFHATGSLLPRDPSAALDWYNRASEAGNVRATAALAVMYVQGDGVERDLEYARRLFDEAEYMGLDVGAMRAAVGMSS